jgi:hypothetical protein
VWPFKKKKPPEVVTYLKLKEQLSIESLIELKQVMNEFGIQAYPLPGTGLVPGTGVIFSERVLTQNELLMAGAKLIESELLSVVPQHKA